MTFANFIHLNTIFILAFIALGVLMYINRKTIPDINKKILITMGIFFIFAISYNLELHLSSYSSHQPWRTVFSAICYFTKPLIFYYVITLEIKRFNKKWLYIVIAIPLFVQLLLSISMSFSTVFVSYNDSNTFKTGPLHFMAFIILGFYLVSFLFFSFFHKKPETREILLISSICVIILGNVIYALFFYVRGADFELTALGLSLLLYYICIMPRKHKLISKYLPICIGFFSFNLLAMFIMTIPMERFNGEVRRYDYAEPLDPVNVQLELSSSAPWIKDHGIPTFENGEINTNESDFASVGYGRTFNASVINKTNYSVSDWSFTITIREKCFINKAWNGMVSITQFGVENVYNGDLMDVNFPGDSSLKYTLLDGEQLIPLEPGDSFTYYPNADKNELPISSSNVKKENYSKVTVGFILYYYGGESADINVVPSLESSVLTYKLHRGLWSYDSFKMFTVLLFISIAGLIFLSGITYKSERLRLQHEHDDLIISEAMDTFINFIDSKDTYTQGHSKRVAEYSRMIASEIGKSEEEQKNIYRIALMHDCGKIGVPGNILNKPAKLTDEEYNIIKMHTVDGGKMLADFSSIPGIQEGALYHHERFDGKGYPKGLKGESIPEIGRIICVADSFDAMNSNRIYRNKMTKEQIKNELINNKDKQFDGRFVDAFLNALKKKKW